MEKSIKPISSRLCSSVESAGKRLIAVRAALFGAAVFEAFPLQQARERSARQGREFHWNLWLKWVRARHLLCTQEPENELVSQVQAIPVLSGLQRFLGDYQLCRARRGREVSVKR